MKTTLLGFAVVLSCGIALGPLLVQTESRTALLVEPPAATHAITSTSRCDDAIEKLRVAGQKRDQKVVVPECPLALGSRVAEVR
jgi:hypothetical protein